MRLVNWNSECKAIYTVHAIAGNSYLKQSKIKRSERSKNLKNGRDNWFCSPNCGRRSSIDFEKIAEASGISCKRVHYILQDKLVMRNLSARWVSFLLAVDQKRELLDILRSSLEYLKRNNKLMMLCYCWQNLGTFLDYVEKGKTITKVLCWLIMLVGWGNQKWGIDALRPISGDNQISLSRAPKHLFSHKEWV